MTKLYFILLLCALTSAHVLDNHHASYDSDEASGLSQSGYSSQGNKRSGTGSGVQVQDSYATSDYAGSSLKSKVGQIVSRSGSSSGEQSSAAGYSNLGNNAASSKSANENNGLSGSSGSRSGSSGYSGNYGSSAHQAGLQGYSGSSNQVQQSRSSSSANEYQSSSSGSGVANDQSSQSGYSGASYESNVKQSGSNKAASSGYVGSDSQSGSVGSKAYGGQSGYSGTANQENERDHNGLSESDLQLLAAQGHRRKLQTPYYKSPYYVPLAVQKAYALPKKYHTKNVVRSRSDEEANSVYGSSGVQQRSSSHLNHAGEQGYGSDQNEHNSRSTGIGLVSQDTISSRDSSQGYSGQSNPSQGYSGQLSQAAQSSARSDQQSSYDNQQGQSGANSDSYDAKQDADQDQTQEENSRRYYGGNDFNFNPFSPYYPFLSQGLDPLSGLNGENYFNAGLGQYGK